MKTVMRRFRSPALVVVLAMTSLANVTLAGGAPQAGLGGNAQLAGNVKDVSGAVMQAVTVRVFISDDADPLIETATDTQGNFSIPLPGGEYRVEVSAPSFTTFDETISVIVGMEPLEVILGIDIVEQEVTVTTEAERLIADTTMSLTSSTLSGDELLDLPANEEDLALYLMLLAGADTTGDLEDDILSNFTIDGFEDGRLPSVDRIAQIIVDPNSMSADGSGPRIEIVTRPGTGAWRRSVSFGFADESLDALTPGEISKPLRQTRDLDFSISGPVIPGFLEMDFNATSRVQERAANSLRAVTPSGEIFNGVVRPEREKGFGIEGDMDLGSNHSLGVEFDYSSSRTENSGVGGFTLPERASDDRGNEWDLDIRDRTFSEDMTNDLRFRIGHEYEQEVPMSSGLAFDVADAFNSGGGTNRSIEKVTVFQVEDRLRLERGEWNLQFGGEFQYRKSANLSENNYNGTYDFASLHDYCRATAFDGVNCLPTQRIVEAALAEGRVPTYLDARGRPVEITGIPTTFTQTSGNGQLNINRVGGDVFVQADRGFGERASLRMGLSYALTNQSRDFLRINPTMNFQYRIMEGTLVSFGTRVNFRDFGQYERLLRNDGSTYQKQLSISSPSFPNPCGGPGTCASGIIEVDELTTSRYVLDPDYQSPYTINPQVNLNQDLPGAVRLTVSYSSSFGIHQERTRNINAPFPGTPLLDEILDLPRDERREIVDRMRPLYPMVGNVRQIESTGRSVSRNFRVRIQPRLDLLLLGMRFSGSFNYNYRWGENDNDFNNPYIREWGPRQRQHQVQSQFRVRMPEEPGIGNAILKTLARATYAGTNFNFNFRANTGSLYSIRSGRDLNGDQSTRDRPEGFIRNSEVGPGRWNLDMTFTKEFYVGTAVDDQAGSNVFPQRGGGGGGRGGDRRGRGPRAGEGRVRFQARVSNLFNHSQPRAYSGVLSSPFFGQPTGFQGGRTVTLSMNLDF